MNLTRIRDSVLLLVALLATLGIAACLKSSSPTAPVGAGSGGGAGARFNLGPFARGQSAQVTFPDAGTFGYHCISHANMGMLGTVQVVAGAADSALVQIGASGFSFSPSTAQIRPGGHVRWVNASTLTNHTVTSD